MLAYGDVDFNEFSIWLHPIWPNLTGKVREFPRQAKMLNTGANTRWAELEFCVCINSAKVNSKQWPINNIIIIN